MIPLHIHTNYSMLRGTLSLEELIHACKKNSLASAAVTDTNGMYGLIQFAKRAKEENIKAILGTYIDDPIQKEIYAVLLARNNAGYGDLCKIITQRKLNDEFSLIGLLRHYWKNLIIISSSTHLLNQINPKNEFYAEIIPAGSGKKEALKLYSFAREKNIPAVGSNPVYFSDKKDFELHRIVTAIRLNKPADDLPEGELADSEFYFKSRKKLSQQFSGIPELEINSYRIADKCNVNLNLGEYKYPLYPKKHTTSSSELLREIAIEGLNRRYRNPGQKEVSRLYYELSVINELNMADYFLIVWDIAKEARRRSMMTIGRGSAANSLVAYCLELTQVDPIKHNLYFERFLNKARSSPPAVDLDFSWKERDEIIKYVFETYGYERVAMISTTVTFRARSAFREVAKAFGLSEKEISVYSKKIPWTNAVNLPDISKLFPESRSLDFSREPWRSIVQYASKLAGFPRHLSIHAGGIVITPGKITDYCALEYANNKGLGLIITQPDMYSIEEMGLVKIDLLSQRSLGVLRDTMESIKNNHINEP